MWGRAGVPPPCDEMSRSSRAAKHCLVALTSRRFISRDALARRFSQDFGRLRPWQPRFALALARRDSACSDRCASKPRRSAETLSRRTSPQLNEQFRKLIVGAMLMLFWLIPAAHFRKQLNGAQPIAHLARLGADDLGQEGQLRCMPIDPRARTVILKATEAGENHLRFERTMRSYS